MKRSRIHSMFLSAALALCLTGSAWAGGAEDAIRDLGSDDFQKREAATAALSAMGDEAIPALAKAAQDKDPEVRWRAERALQSIRARGGSPSGEKDPKRATPTPPPPPQGQERIPAPQIVPDALEGARARLKAVEEELKRQRPELGELFKGFAGPDLFQGDFGKILEDMEKRFRDLDSPRGRPGARRDFWTFQWKDGQWQILRGDESAAAKTGLSTSAVPGVLKAQLRLEGEPDGRVVDEVRAGSLAEKAGLAKYDLLLRVDGAAILDEDDLEALASPGEHKLAIVRKGERREVVLATPAEAVPATPAPEEKRAPEAKPKRAPAPPPETTPSTPETPPAKKDGLRRY